MQMFQVFDAFTAGAERGTIQKNSNNCRSDHVHTYLLDHPWHRDGCKIAVWQAEVLRGKHIQSIQITIQSKIRHTRGCYVGPEKQNAKPQNCILYVAVIAPAAYATHRSSSTTVNAPQLCLGSPISTLRNKEHNQSTSAAAVVDLTQKISTRYRQIHRIEEVVLTESVLQHRSLEPLGQLGGIYVRILQDITDLHRTTHAGVCC